MRTHLKMSGTSYCLDETYVKVGTEWKYLYMAVDSMGDTIEFMLSAKRDVSAAKRFFRKLMRADHRRLPFTIGTERTRRSNSFAPKSTPHASTKLQRKALVNRSRQDVS